LENVLAILWRHAATAIGHFDAAGTIDRHGHFRSSRRVSDRVLNQISQRVFDGVSVCFYVHWPLASRERNGLNLGYGPGRDRADNRGCDFVEIDGAKFERDGIQPGHAKELPDQPVHPRDVGPQFLELAVSIHRLESRSDDSERRAKLM